MTQPHLYLFLDEGGNLVFSLKGTKYFTLTAATQTRPFTLDSALLSLKYGLIEEGHDVECFHASEDRQAVRDQVFAAIGQHLNDLRLDTIVVEKRKTWPHLQVPEAFYSMMLGYLVRYVLERRDLAAYSEVIVMTDSLPLKSKREAFEKAIKQTLSSMLPAGSVYRVMHHASQSCIGLQVADYCNWAVYRKWEKSDRRSYDLIRGAIRSEFDIFWKGGVFYY